MSNSHQLLKALVGFKPISRSMNTFTTPDMFMSHTHMPTFDALNGLHHDSHRSRGEGLEALLGVDVHPGEPAPEARVRVVPANHHFGAARLLEHV